jgi:hypothetical protein
MSEPTPKALKRWNTLAPEQQQALLKRCTRGNVIELPSEGEAKVVSIFFGMDLYIGSSYEYIFPHDIKGEINGQTHSHLV